MDFVKLPLQSRVVWAGIVAFLASALQLFGVTDFFAQDGEQEIIVDMVMNGITLVSGVVAIWGRFTAKSKVVMSTKPKVTL